MATLQTYFDLKDGIDSTKYGVFFAFNAEQFKEGYSRIVKQGFINDGDKVTTIGAGCYASRQCMTNYIDAINNSNKKIGDVCDAQEVYDYEFSNHECGYTGDDTEAMKIVVCYFSEEKAKTIKRKYPAYTIDQLYKLMNN